MPFTFCFKAASDPYFLEDPQTSVSLGGRKNKEPERSKEREKGASQGSMSWDSEVPGC